MSGADDLARLRVTIDTADELFLSEEPKMVDVGGGVMRPTNAKVLADLPTSPANSKTAMQFNVKFWADQGEQLEKRFASWSTQ